MGFDHIARDFSRAFFCQFAGIPCNQYELCECNCMTDRFEPTQRQPIFNVPRIILIFIGAFCAIHVYKDYLAGDDARFQLILDFAFIAQKYHESVHVGYSYYSLYWSPVSYAFLHADWLHLGVNCLWLLAFGGVVALRFGWFRFILLFGLGAIGGALLFYLTHDGTTAIVIGASGSVSALMGTASRFAFPKGGGFSRNTHKLPSQSLVETFQNKSAASFILIFVLINLGLGAGSILGLEESASIAWQAHIGGLLVGVLLFDLLDPYKSPAVRPPQHPE